VPEDDYYSGFLIRLCFKIAMNQLFNAVITVIIIINTLLLTLDRYPDIPEAQQNVLNQVNYCFTVIFTVEVIIKLLGLGAREFAKDKFNIFDLVVVVLSIIEISLSSGTGSFSALRAFRLFRIFKIFRVGDLRVLIDSIGFTISTIGNYVVLLILFIYVFALLGMQFFAG